MGASHPYTRMTDDREARFRAAVSAWAERAAKKILKEMAQEHQGDVVDMLKKPRGSSLG